MPWRRSLFVVVASLVLASCLAISACSKMTFPCDPFRGCPASTSSSSSPGPSEISVGKPSDGPPDFVLAGTLVTDGGLEAKIDSQLWLGQPRVASSRQYSSDLVHVEIPVSGSVMVANGTFESNPAAASVSYTYVAGYPQDSEVCRSVGQTGSRNRLAGSHCWQLIGEASLYSFALGQADPVSPGHSRTASIGAESVISVDALAGDATTIVDELRRPAIVAVWTRDVPGAPRKFRFRNACFLAANAPSAPTSASRDPQEQRVQVGATAPVNCGDVSW